MLAPSVREFKKNKNAKKIQLLKERHTDLKKARLYDAGPFCSGIK